MFLLYMQIMPNFKTTDLKQNYWTNFCELPSLLLHMDSASMILNLRNLLCF